MKPQPSIDGV